MKKICTVFLSLLLTLTTVFCINCRVYADDENDGDVNISELVSIYSQCLKASDPHITLKQTRKYLIDGLSSGLYARLFKKTSSEIYNRSKKIMDFYNLSNSDDFVNYYHPNSDLTINENEILNDLPDDNSLCIMLFGNKLNEDGSMSDKFTARCKTALAMAEKYPNALIMITGGHTAGYDHLSEAETGRNWLIEKGVDENRIVIEKNSWDTFSNILCTFSTSKLNEHDEITSFVVVSSDYHVPKCSIYLMTYIYAFGLDLPKEKGGRGYQYLGNLGAVLDN